jgi:hypothetical protein
MLFVLVPERNGVIVARADAKPPDVCNGKSCLFQSNKVNFFLSLIITCTQHAAHFTFNKIQQFLFYQVFEAKTTKLNDMYMITMRALCITAEKCRGIIFCQNNRIARSVGK